MPSLLAWLLVILLSTRNRESCCAAFKSKSVFCRKSNMEALECRVWSMKKRVAKIKAAEKQSRLLAHSNQTGALLD